MVASGGRLRSRSLTAVRRSYLGRADQIALRLWEKAGIGTVFCLKKLVTLSQLCRRLQDGSIIICVLDTTRLIEVWIDETGRGAWFPGEGVDSVDLKQKPQLSPLSWRAAVLLFGIQQSAFRAAKALLPSATSPELPLESGQRAGRRFRAEKQG